MSEPSESSALHSPEWWNQDNVRADTVFEPYREMPVEAITPAVNAQVMARVLSELIRLRTVVRVLALESAPRPRAPRRKQTEGQPNGQ